MSDLHASEASDERLITVAPALAERVKATVLNLRRQIHQASFGGSRQMAIQLETPGALVDALDGSAATVEAFVRSYGEQERVGWHNFKQLQHIVDHCIFREDGFNPEAHDDTEELGAGLNVTDYIDALAESARAAEARLAAAVELAFHEGRVSALGGNAHDGERAWQSSRSRADLVAQPDRSAS